MERSIHILAVSAWLVGCMPGWAGQVPGAASDPDIPISHRDRVYSAEQFSNTVSVTDPVDNKLLGVIRLGDPLPASLSPLYRGQLLVHGLGFSPDHRTIAVVAIGSNAVNFIDTATNLVKHVTYVGRSPHEAFFTRRQGGLGRRKGRELRRSTRRRELRRKGADHRGERSGHDDLLAGWEIRLCLLVVHS